MCSWGRQAPLGSRDTGLSLLRRCTHLRRPRLLRLRLSLRLRMSPWQTVQQQQMQQMQHLAQLSLLHQRPHLEQLWQQGAYSSGVLGSG